ncbi:MAG: thioredoxin-disulfide reductase [Candidatus Woesearchaeota archaeon]|nr:thioredoxin-disulfide reductase [Candidatus Woesearchaeota archaeon]
MPKKSASAVRNVIIIGGGIASHTAALYTARATLQPLVIAGIEPDQLSTTSVVENFPGFPEGINGPDLITNCKKQAERFGAEYIDGKADSCVKNKDGFFEVGVDGKKFLTRTVIIGTGASARSLGIPGEKDYWGRGVSTCATCDAALFRNKTVAVIGGGDSAMEESLALYKFAAKIYIIHRRDEFKASKIMQDRVLKLKDKIEVIWNTLPTKVLGTGKLVSGLTLQDVNTKKERELKVDGMFLAIGHTPNTAIFSKLITLDEHGYVVTDKRSRTSQEGIYACGDVQDPIFKQAITSAGTGCQAALEAEKYIEQLKATGKY